MDSRVRGRGGRQEDCSLSTTLAAIALLIFIAAYILVIGEETFELKKSKPVVLAAGLIWLLVGMAFRGQDHTLFEAAASNAIKDYCELFLFLLVSITYVNVLEERKVFDAVRAKLIAAGLTYRGLFWAIGTASFVLSIVLANMTTAMVLGAVALGLGRGNPKFTTLACINIVVAANAGGAFCPFGDVTSLMVWQAGKLGFWPFFKLFLPALVSWLIPALTMTYAVPAGKPTSTPLRVAMKPGALVIIALFALSIGFTVYMQTALGLAPVFGMILGLGLLQAYAFILQRRGKRQSRQDMVLDSFAEMQRVEWDTLLFFFGIMLSLAGLGVFGWLTLLQTTIYNGTGIFWANTSVGVLSALLDNVPLVYAVLQMNPAMDEHGWLLLTLSAGVGGSLLSIGSAAGVALMGQAGKNYSFMKHLRWMPAIALGFAAAIGLHQLLN